MTHIDGLALNPLTAGAESIRVFSRTYYHIHGRLFNMFKP